MAVPKKGNPKYRGKCRVCGKKIKVSQKHEIQRHNDPTGEDWCLGSYTSPVAIWEIEHQSKSL